jgi:hypothetical protein
MNRHLLLAKTLVDDARAAFESCAGLNSRLAARRITLFLENRMTSTGLSVAQFGLMAHVAAALDDTLGALAARTGLNQSTLLAIYTIWREVGSYRYGLASPQCLAHRSWYAPARGGAADLGAGTCLAR